ncbi:MULTISPECIES: STAS domain-containing protein [Methanoculleus]|nr:MULTISPECIES: STAS domain-containing protein [Methanoculleus]MCC7554623.1 STAS domain-containing protein [Methanoculleus marisnigri]UYU17381.1 STAS domain-containing protein [Methanoculleus submarinus]
MDVTVSERDDTAVVSVDGRIDAESAKRLDTVIAGVLARGGKRVLVNLEKAAYMSSSGLRVLLGKFRDLRRVDGEMALCAVQPDVYKVFLMAGVHEVFPIYVGLDEILAAGDEEKREEESTSP